MADERHFDHYDKRNRLINQVYLLEKLEQNNFEVKGKRILTTDNVGIPVTAMLLLLNDSLSNITHEQDLLLNVIQSKNSRDLSSQELINELNLLTSPAGQTFDEVTWQENLGLEFDYSPLISGSIMITESNYYTPNPPNYFNNIKGSLFSNDPSVTVDKNWIISQSKDGEKRSFINLYKEIILFVEFSYALRERVINSEVSNFNSYINVNIVPPEPIGDFKKNCDRRADIIHKGFMNIRIDNLSGYVIIGNKSKRLLDSFNQSFNETTEWINNLYGEMLSKL